MSNNISKEETKINAANYNLMSKTPFSFTFLVLKIRRAKKCNQQLSLLSTELLQEMYMKLEQLE